MIKAEQLRSTLARRNPVTVLRRSARRFGRRPRAMQLRTVAVVLVTEAVNSTLWLLALAFTVGLLVTAVAVLAWA